MFCPIAKGIQKYTHSVRTLGVALQINTALQILEMYFFQFGGHTEFLNNSNSDWGRQTAVFQFLRYFNIN